MAQLQWFIRRPHAIERMREHAGFSKDADSVMMETELRKALDEAAKNTTKNFLNSCKPDQYAVRVAIPGRNVVYAILKKPNDNQKGYDYIVPTVLTMEMFQSWTKDGKLGSIEELHGNGERRPMPVLKPQLCLRWSNGDGKEHWGDYCADDVPEQIRKLLDKGVNRDTIKVYKEISFKIEVSLEGITS